MRRVPWWAALSATAAPVLLIGGWTVAGARQPMGYSSVRDTISALAGRAATDRWVMTVGLVGLGICHLVTALGLRPAAVVGRLLLAVGGLATLLVAGFPLPTVGTSSAHQAVAGVAFITLGVWPAWACRRGGPVPWTLRPLASYLAAATMLVLLGLFAMQLFGDGARVGLTERLVAGAQALWPLVAVLAARRAEPAGAERRPTNRAPVSTDLAR